LAIFPGIVADVFILDHHAQSTYENAVDSKALMQKYGLHSTAVVSSDYQMRRASLIFAHVFRGTGTRFTYVAVKGSGFPPHTVVDDQANDAPDVLSIRGDSGVLPGAGAVHNQRLDPQMAILVSVQVYALRAMGYPSSRACVQTPRCVDNNIICGMSQKIVDT
jgi:hypothetical protein